MRTFSFNQFDGGIVNDPRTGSNVKSRMVTNFDALTDSHRLTPYRSSVNGDDSSSTSQKKAFVIALRSGTTYMLFSLGRQSAIDKHEILMKALTTGASNDLDDAVWATPVNNQGSIATPNYNLFVYYAKTALIYMAAGGSRIETFDPTSVAAFDSAFHALSYTNIAQGLVHSKDDILYIPYDNKIAKNDNGSWTDTALTLPASVYITSICEKGNYLAIGVAPLSGMGKSRVFLWDRDSTLTTLSENIDWGQGILQVLEEIEGTLVGITYENNATRNRYRVTFRNYSEVNAKKFAEFVSTSQPTISLQKQKIDNRVYFLMSLTLNGAVREGVWSIGPSNNGLEYSIFHEHTPNNDTALGAGVLQGFSIVGDYTFVSYINNASIYQLSKTDSQANYTATSIYETLINPGMPELIRGAAAMRTNQKQVKAMLLAHEPLPLGASAKLRYRVDGGSSWITVVNNTDVGSVAKEGVYAANGDAITAGREYEFRLESTGGAIITEMKYKVEENTTLL